MRHHFTVDVEEYFQVSAFERVVPRANWDVYERRSVHSVAVLLEMLDRAGARGTFFVLGWLAQRLPNVVRAISAAGHEIASHGWDHARVTTLHPDAFRVSVRESKQALEDLTGSPVLGFRAPSYSITPGVEWALDILVEEGYRYDASLFPVWRPDRYGYPTAAREPHWLLRAPGALAEIPPATVRWAGVTLPAGGGAYFRLFPYALVRAALRACEQSGHPGTFYIHPWELDTEQPRLAVPWLTRVRHYGGLRHTRERLSRLLTEFQFTSIASTLAQCT